jgi:hypothetical protein
LHLDAAKQPTQYRSTATGGTQIFSRLLFHSCLSAPMVFCPLSYEYLRGLLVRSNCAKTPRCPFRFAKTMRQTVVSDLLRAYGHGTSGRAGALRRRVKSGGNRDAADANSFLESEDPAGRGVIGKPCAVFWHQEREWRKSELISTLPLSG